MNWIHKITTIVYTYSLLTLILKSANSKLVSGSQPGSAKRFFSVHRRFFKGLQKHFDVHCFLVLSFTELVKNFLRTHKADGGQGFFCGIVVLLINNG